MDTDQEKLVSWLNDAYGMEQGLIPILENHAKDITDNNDMKNRILQHVEETKRHSNLIKGCLERYDKTPSTVKATIGKVTSGIQNMTTGIMHDEEVKNTLSDFAAENFEIASYKALITAATNVGDDETATVCEQILMDEQDMADFLDKHLTIVVNSAMQTHEA